MIDYDQMLANALRPAHGITVNRSGFDMQRRWGVLGGKDKFIPEVLQEATLWLDSQYSVAGEPRVINRGTGGSALDAKYGSVLGAYVYDGAAVLPGLTGNSLSTPSAAALNVAGDIELVARIATSAFGQNEPTIHGNFAAGGGYGLTLRSSGTIQFDVVVGAVTISQQSAAVVTGLTPFTGWLKVTRNATTGDISYYKAADQATEPSSWTLINTANRASGSIDAAVNNFGIGYRLSANNFFYNGSIHRTIVRDGIGGTTVLDVDLANVADYATSFTATTGQTVTVNSTSSDTNDPLLLTHTGENYGFTPAVGANGLTVSTPGYTITGDVDIRMEISLDDWAHSGVAADVFGQDNGDGARWARIRLNSGGSVEFSWFPLGTWASRVAQSSSEALSSVFSPGDRGWLRITLDTDNGSGGYDVTFYTSTDGVTWDQLGAVRTGGATTSLFSTGTSVRFTANSTWGGGNLATRWYRCLVKDGIDGTTVLDVNAATDITDAGATSFTATSGQTVTVNRATSGRKTALVTRPVWLFGTDDYLEIADNDLLDMGDATDFTVVILARVFATPVAFGRLVSKQVPATSTSAGWNVGIRAGRDPYVEVGDGTTRVNTNAHGDQFAYGELVSVGITVDRTADEYRPFVNNTSLLAKDISTVGSVDNAVVLKVGALSNGSSYQDFEAVAVAVWRRVLTPDEIAAINTYYGTV